MPHPPRDVLPTPPVPAAWRAILAGLLDLPTAPFHERRVADAVAHFAAGRGLTCRADRFGNLIVARGAPPHRLAFTAHLDHPGFWALAMDGPQRLLAQWMGHVPARCFPGAAVVFHGEGAPPVRGTVREVADNDTRGNPSRVAIAIDAPVAAGTPGTWDLPRATIGRRYIDARAIDDLAGVASLLCLLDHLETTGAPHGVLCLFTRAEEGGFLGAIALCEALADGTAGIARPEAIVNVEMSPARPHVPAGRGPVLRVGDRRATFDPALGAWAAEAAAALAAEDPSFVFQRALMDGGSCEASVFSAFGLPTAALCAPLERYHNVDPKGGGLVRERIATTDFRNLVLLESALVAGQDRLAVPGSALRDWCAGWLDAHRHLFDDPAGEGAVKVPREVIRFDALAWQAGTHPLERKKCAARGGATLLEFAPGFADPNWCANGHAGYVLDGTLGLAFGDGEELIGAGEAFVVEPGSRHRAFNPGPGAVRLFIAPR